MAEREPDALICDFAEVYGVFDWEKLPVRLAATLAAGLGRDSRTCRALSGVPYTVSEIMLARALDALNLILWDGRGQRPASFWEAMSRDCEGTESDVVTFASGDDFMEARARYIKS